MMLDALLGNEEVKASLKTALAGGTLSHAVLLAAPDGCGRGFAARCLAADYLYPQGGPGAAAVMAGQSPELLILAGAGRSGQIPVDAVRAARADLFRTGLSAEGRVVWVRDAGRMAPPAYNALLKVLEEPPPGVLFLLTAASAPALPATIRSRCAGYTLAPLPIADCEAALREKLPPGTDTALPALLATVYGGRLGLGLAAGKNEDRLSVLRDAKTALSAVSIGDRYGLLRVFSAYEGRASEKSEDPGILDGRARREALLFDLAQLLALALRGEAAPGTAALPAQTAADLLPLLSEARGRLARFATPKITLSALAVQMVPTQ